MGGPRVGRRARVAGAVLAAAVVGMAAFAVSHRGRPGEGGTGHAVVAVAPSPPPAPSPGGGSPPAEPTTGWIVTLAQPTPWSATPGGPAAGHLGATNPFGTAQVLAVVGAPGTSGWLDVELPVRPNGSTGWIPGAGASLTWTPYSVMVDLGARTLTVLDGSTTVLTTPAAVGSAGTATPGDRTYLWELVRPDDPNGAYGPYIFGL
ncbi:MAG: L,D-transpeptidase, partial [Acidimicrobiales bacterium]